MANEENLVKGKATQFRTGEEQAKIAKKGGQASGRKRREQKTYKELAKTMLSAKIDDKEMKAIAEKFGIKNPDVKTMTLLGMIRASIGGSHNAFDRLIELSGEKTQDSDEGIIQELVEEFKKI